MAHLPVLLNPSIEALAIDDDATLIDGTYGRGGHAQAMLDRLGPNGRLLVIDRDPEAVEHAQAQFGNDPRVWIRHANFDEMPTLADALGWRGEVNGVLLDLGVSSPQLDQAGRGFSFMNDGPLDMRMDPHSGVSAAEWLAHVSERELAEVIKSYGEERRARRIARAIVAARQQHPIETTAQLANVIASVVSGRPGHHPATKTFQAIRIFINRELEALDRWLDTILPTLAPGARLAVISFHSLEDRRVKRAWQALAKPPAANRRWPTSETFTPQLKLIGRSIAASDEACQTNPRARSARLRVAEKLMEAA